MSEVDFDSDDKSWYITYEDALLAMCSETIGPRLPDGFDRFIIEDPDSQLKIDEWFMIKNNCYDDWKRVRMAVQDEKQFSSIVPSQNMSPQQRDELKSQRPYQSIVDVANLKQRVLQVPAAGDVDHQNNSTQVDTVDFTNAVKLMSSSSSNSSNGH